MNKLKDVPLPPRLSPMSRSLLLIKERKLQNSIIIRPNGERLWNISYIINTGFNGVSHNWPPQGSSFFEHELNGFINEKFKRRPH